MKITGVERIHNNDIEGVGDERDVNEGKGKTMEHETERILHLVNELE